MALGVLLLPPGGFAQQERMQDPSPNITALRGAHTSSTEAQTTLTFFYGKRQTFRSEGIPQRWANVLGNVHNSGGLSSLAYSLNGGPSNALSIGPDTRRLFNAGDFNIDLSWPQLFPLPDSNLVVVTATDTHANTKKDTVVVRYYANTQWPIPATVDWAASPDITSAAQVVDGQWILGGGGVRNVDFGYDRLLAIGDTTWSDYEVTVPITIHSINADGYNPTSGQPVVGVFTRWIGHTDDPVSGWQPKSGWNPSGALGMYAFNAPSNGGERLEIWQRAADASGKTIPFGQTTLFKMRVETQVQGDLYALRVWPQGESEPLVWDLTYLDQTKRAHRGSVLLLSHYVDATFGNVQIVPTIALPVQLVQFSGLVAGEHRVRLSWRTLGETSNYGFEVQRAPNEPRTFTSIPGGFVAGHGSTIQAHEYSFTDSGAVSGVWYYRLRQIDLDGSSTYHDPIRISLDGVTSAIGAKVPATFVMHQNFPNPFNPATIIRFELPAASFVRLTVHDMLGRTVATLVNAPTPAGSHEVTFDAAGLASGTYIYRMQVRPLDSAIGRDSRSGAGGFVDTKRLVIIK